MKSAQFQPDCLATAIGTMPHVAADGACKAVLKHLPAIPVWPQLTKMSFKENMYIQFSEGFPGFTLEGEHFHVHRSASLYEDLEKLYQAFLDNDYESWKVNPEYAAGLYEFVNVISPRSHLALKGQVTGPISWGLTVTDQEQRPILYDDTLADALAKHLALKAAWEEKYLTRGSPFTIIFVDEPYMSAFGSAFVSLTREKVVNLLEAVFKGITGLKGVHCCGNTDWSILLDTSVDIVNPDVYNYEKSFNLYPEEIVAFLERGGIIAWGIVPNDEASLVKETVSSLRDRLDDVITPLTRKGIKFRTLLRRSLVTPCCGLSSLSLEGAEVALEVTASLSRELRKKYLGELT